MPITAGRQIQNTEIKGIPIWVQQMDAPVLPRDKAPSRYFTWLLVVLAHACLIAAILLSHPRLSRESKQRVHSLSLLRLPHESTKLVSAKITVRLNPFAIRLKIDKDLLPPPVLDKSNAATLEPSEQQKHIDWERESALVVQSSIDKVTKDKSYRDLSSLTPEQLDWVKKNHMEPMPGFKWDRSSRGQMLRHGIFKLNDYCVLVVVIPFCQFGGKIQYNGDLFKDMHDANLPDH